MPFGWLGAVLSETRNRLGFLVDEGMRCIAGKSCDDQPFCTSLFGKTVMSIPYSLYVKGTYQFFKRKLTAEEFEALIKGQFDWLYGEAEQAPLVRAIALHPFGSSVPRWTGVVHPAPEYVVGHEGVWLATGSGIARHFVAQVPDE